MSLKAIDIKELNFNPMTLIGKEWMLVSAGNENAFNTMTAQWGHLGAIWNGDMPTSVIYLRPQRYTREFVDKNDYYTLSFLILIIKLIYYILVLIVAAMKINLLERL